MKVIITIGFFVHIIFLFSIFDIYFKSPVITGIPPRPELTDAPANRLVLFVADGLRADSFFRLNHNKSSETPYLRSILEKYGTWGVSHTRVPTESRPGHVALIAGLYEDPSAVARGWQENPVHFDSAFNRSTETWSWGSPDILPMFSKGSKSGKVHTYYYNSEEEDFSGKSDTFLLDLWVFKKVENFFNDARKDKDLFLRLHQKKIIFFLHLLGLDTAGHTYKPYSRELEKNLNIVDAGIKQIEKVIQTFYNYDNKTAFIFTSDHGMTDWGSHGSGSTHETETPIVSWGAGINFPKESINLKSTLSPINWGVNDKFRKDIMQADVSPLISALIGSAVSVNSVIKISKILMVKSTVGLEYYHTYYQVLLLSCISLSFISWIILLLINIFSTNERRKSFHPYYGIFDIGYGCAIITVMFIIFKQSLPAIMYIYCGHPFMLWWAVCRKLRPISCDMKSKNVFFVLKAIGVSAAYIIGTEIMVLSFFYRYLLSICIVFLCLWGFMNLNQSDKLVKFHWILSSLMLAIFPAMPIEKGDDGSNTSLIFLGGLLWIILSILQFKRSLDITSMIQILFLLMSMLVVVSTRNNFKERLGLPLKNMIVSWILLVVSPLFILVASLQITLRLKHIGRGLAVPFILLSVGHEPIF
ncbi:GPI ethanolamine phosphate transferase 1-like isoform X2 [Ctenocephalides felis]|uniref:GPI ethanolamine phosphate transferase 1-like isoform X2 n=1 Tax=Ctenocephalides felis TaxID=7515 RepID=UPI000E6E50EF|nr:GPI ethanolamine phosphate transferase 1-like isoform X2 [Ctenocephalides felis]